MVNGVTVESLQDLNNLRGKQGEDHPKIKNFLLDLKNQLRGIGINPYDMDTAKNVMVSEDTAKKIINFCKRGEKIEHEVYPNIDPANWEFF